MWSKYFRDNLLAPVTAQHIQLLLRYFPKKFSGGHQHLKHGWNSGLTEVSQLAVPQSGPFL